MLFQLGVLAKLRVGLGVGLGVFIELGARLIIIVNVDFMVKFIVVVDVPQVQTAVGVNVPELVGTVAKLPRIFLVHWKELGKDENE